MKKEFMEPEMKRIELNMLERIANSDSYAYESFLILRQTGDPGSCGNIVVKSEMTYTEFMSQALGGTPEEQNRLLAEINSHDCLNWMPSNAQLSTLMG